MSSWFDVLSVNVKFLSFQECFFLQLYYVILESWKLGEKISRSRCRVSFQPCEGVKVIWRWSCKSYFPLDWLFPMPGFALPSLCLCLCLLCWTLLRFFPLRGRDLFSWTHFCVSLAVLMQMSTIAHIANVINMLKKFLPSFLLSREKKIAELLTSVETLLNAFFLT